MASASGPRRVLVVNDHADVAAVLADLIALDGHLADVARNGLAALNQLAARDYDVILCEVDMPALDGPAVYEVLARHQPELLGRFVLISDFVLNPLGERVEAWLAHTPVPIVGKPFNRTEIREMIERTAAISECPGASTRAGGAADGLRIYFACPICREIDGREIILLAELEATTPLLMVSDLAGCLHADGFGKMGALSPEQEQRLITTALDAFEADRARRDDGEPRRRGYL